jgi:hypothetical protein
MTGVERLDVARRVREKMKKSNKDIEVLKKIIEKSK